jgi:protein MPE1
VQQKARDQPQIFQTIHHLRVIYVIDVAKRVRLPSIILETLTNRKLGHWIQQCPTNDDPNFDGRPRVKRTTGIPRSFLKTVAKPEALSKDGLSDTSNQPSGVMVNAEGEFVVAEPDNASWEQFRAKAIASEQAQKMASKGNEEIQELGLECPIDNRLFVDPTKTPCCGKVYCNECITNALLEGDLICPNCQTEGIILDELASDEEMTAKVNDYKKESELKPRASEEVQSPKANSAAVESPKATTTSEPQVAETLPARDSTTTPSGLSTVSNGSKKRPAEDELDSTRIPKAPAAMRQQQAQGNKSSTSSGVSQNMPFPQMPVGTAMGTNGMPSFGFSQAGGYMGMDPGMMNPMMGGYGGFSAMGGINGMNGMPGMNGMGYPQFNGMYPAGFNGAMPNGLYNPMGTTGTGMNPGMMGAQNMNMNGNTMPQNISAPNHGQALFPNQQQFGNSQTDEDNPYFRQPINPHRHQGRQQRRPRPSDYREL